MTKRVLLGIDFIGANFPAALYTIQQWWAYANRSDQHVCFLGVSNFCDRRTPFSEAIDLTPSDALRVVSAFIPKEQLVQWTSDIDARLLDAVKKNGCRSQPFYPDFNYGSVVNRLLLLASSHGCDYLVRVDPGTLPPKTGEFAELMHDHETKIGSDSHTVVSRRYSDRLALRNMFVQGVKEAQHAELVKEHTGIDVDNQVTGGAMLTLKTPGTPAICFPVGAGLTLVWASDDGVYQVLGKDNIKGEMLDDKEEHRVQRFDAEGKPKKPKEYYRGILGAVCLKALRDGKDMGQAKNIARSFLDDLRGILDPMKCADIDPEWLSTFLIDNIAPDEFVKAIRAGYENHGSLLREWDKICEVLRPSVVRETSANNRMDTDGE